jgi:hypothetical protein
MLLIGMRSGGHHPETWENTPDQGVEDGPGPADPVSGDQLQHSPPSSWIKTKLNIHFLIDQCIEHTTS